MPNNPYDSPSDHNLFEKVGLFSVPILVCVGLIFYLVGVICMSSRFSENWIDFLFNDFFLIILMAVPFFIQVPILLKFLKVLRSEIKESKNSSLSADDGLTEFFQYYCCFMCFALLGYSTFWFLYNWDLAGWSSNALFCYSILSLACIFVLVWIIAICTKIIIGGKKNAGLITDSELSQEKYDLLCRRLNLVPACKKFLDVDPPGLKEILITECSDSLTGKKTSVSQDDHTDIKNIIAAFSDLTDINLPLAGDDKNIAKITSILQDKEQPAQIKPAIRVLDLLREDSNESMFGAVREGDVTKVTKLRLIKALNNIIRNPGFYMSGKFLADGRSTPVETAHRFFMDSKRVKSASAEKIQRENRHLFDVHLLQASVQPGHSKKENPKKHWVSRIFLFGLNDYRERKLIEGLERFPFQMLLFFFTIFICIVYLFAFSFAFHDQNTLMISPTKTPALFINVDYPKNNNNFESEIKDYSQFGVAKVPKNDRPNEKLPNFFFFFYTSSNSGTDFKDVNTDNRDAQSQLNVKDELNLKEQRDIANKQNLDHLLTKLREVNSTAKKIFIEIIGRTDDFAIDAAENKKIQKQTYSSNYDLSLARAENFKFELLRLLQDKHPDILEKIEWTCIPGSNDDSLKRGVPLANRQHFALKDVSNAPVTANADIGDTRSRIKTLQDRIADLSPPKIEDEDKKNALMARRQLLQKQTDNLLELFDRPQASTPESKTSTGNPASSISPLAEAKELILSIISKLEWEYKIYTDVIDGPKENTNPGEKDFMKKIDKFDGIGRDIDSALVFFASTGQSANNANKRITEVYVDTVPYAIPENHLNLTDYILYSLTVASYGDIKPTTQYAKLLSILVNLTTVFFVVVFLNALMSVRRSGDEIMG